MGRSSSMWAAQALTAAAVAGWRSWSATMTFTVPGPFHLLTIRAAPTPSTSLAQRW